LILASGILSARADAQITQPATTTNVPLGIPPVRNPINPTIQQSNNPISGVPSIIETNPFFGSAFQSKIGSQVATTTNFFTSIPPQSITTNPFSASAGQSEIGGQSTKTITNFLFTSSPQSWVGQGRGVFAAPTNGYNISLVQIAPDILQFSVTATNSNATNWLLEFSTTNDFFAAGAYSNAVNAGGSPARLLFGGMGRGDNTSDGAFNVLEATYSNNQIVSFAADFIQLDNDDANSWNEGSIRYNSTIPDSVNLFMAPVAISVQKGNTILTWSTNLAGFQLEYATNLPASSWFTNNSVPAIVGGQYMVTVTNGVSAGTHLYRLAKPL
jgi:hypothetical protein